MKAADFRCWHKADVPEVSPDVRFQERSGHAGLGWACRLMTLAV